MRSFGFRRYAVVTFSLLAIAISGCDATSMIGPDNQLEVANVVDSFQWQVSALDNVSETLTYSWENTGTLANVNQSSGASVSSGAATLRITDGAGAEVYSRSLTENGTFETSSGASGMWTITVTLSEVVGTLNFRVEKP